MVGGELDVHTRIWVGFAGNFFFELTSIIGGLELLMLKWLFWTCFSGLDGLCCWLRVGDGSPLIWLLMSGGNFT